MCDNPHVIDAEETAGPIDADAPIPFALADAEDPVEAAAKKVVPMRYWPGRSCETDGYKLLKEMLEHAAEVMTLARQYLDEHAAPCGCDWCETLKERRDLGEAIVFLEEVRFLDQCVERSFLWSELPDVFLMTMLDYVADKRRREKGETNDRR